MFFIMGISQGRKVFDWNPLVICKQCGAYGRYQVFMTYSYLSLFFIPCFKWDKRYYVQMSCCDAIYALDPEVGRRIARGEEIEIREEALSLVRAGYRSRMKRCMNCGYETEEEFDYCPKCGRRF